MNNKVKKYMEAERYDAQNFRFSKSRVCRFITIERLYVPVGSVNSAIYVGNNILTTLDVYVFGLRIWHQEKESQNGKCDDVFSYWSEHPTCQH